MIKKNSVDVELLDHQADFLECETKFVGLIGGIGSGKTWTGAHFVIQQATRQPETLGFIGANTYKQLEHATLAAVFRELENLGIPYEFNQNKGLLEFNGAKILCSSMENFNALRGIEVGWFWLDEVRDLAREAFDMMMGRLRDPKAKNLLGRVTTSPAGFNWVYDYFHKSGKHHNDHFSLIRARSNDNTFLPDGYLDSLKSRYTDTQYKQEIDGEFVNLYTGQAYKAFTKDNIVIEHPFAPRGAQFNSLLPIILGLDFNVAYMAWTLLQKRLDDFHVGDEIWVENTDTEECVRNVLIPKLFEVHPDIKRVGVWIAGDATGESRKTSAKGQTDYDIITNELDDAGIPWENHTPAGNPGVKDRVNNVNTKLRSADGKVKLTVHQRCEHVIDCFQRTTWKQGATGAILDQKTNPELTHASDSVGYPIMALSPISARNSVGTVKVIRR